MKFVSWSLKKLKYHFWMAFQRLMTPIACFFFREKNQKNQKTKTVTPLDFYLSDRRRKIESKLSKHRGDQFNQKKSIPAREP